MKTLKEKIKDSLKENAEFSDNLKAGHIDNLVALHLMKIIDSTEADLKEKIGMLKLVNELVKECK